MKSTHSPGY